MQENISFLHTVNSWPQRVMGVPRKKLGLPLGIREYGSVDDCLPGENGTYSTGFHALIVQLPEKQYMVKNLF